MKNWVRPMAVEEAFVANTTVSACYSLVCTLPGKDPYTEDGENPYNFKNDLSDRGNHFAEWAKQDGFRYLEKHQSCAKPSYWNATTNTFYESGINKAPVSNVDVDFSVDAGEGKHPAIWTSKFGLEYHHIGFAVDESAAHPNRS